MTLDKFKEIGRKLVSPLASVAVRIGLTPNQISVIAFGVAIVAGGLYYFGTPLGYVLGALAVGANGFLDVLDGQVARKTGVESDRGDFLDHVLDRYSDMVIVIGVAAGLGRGVLGLLALSGVFMTSYMGTQAQAVGAGREYSGVIGRADRLVIVALGGVSQAALVSDFVDVATEFGVSGLELTPLGWVLLLFAVAGHLTALQRFFMTWRDMS